MSALASLDPSTVERIRELMRQPSTGKDAQNARPAAPASPNPSAPTVRSTPRPVASVPLSSAPAASSSTSSSAAAQGSSSTARPAGPASAAGRGVGAASTTTSAQPRPVAAVVPPATARPSVPTAANTPAPSQPAAQVSASGAAGLRQRTRVTAGDDPGRKPGPSIPLSSPPLARSGGGLASRLGGGPLSAHTPHRGTGIRPGGGGPALTPSAESRPSRTQGSSPAVPGGQEGAPGTASFQPLKRSDYMSSAGIRPPVQRTTPASSPPSAPARRPGDDALTEGARREPPSVPRRPLPPVAAPRRLRTGQVAPRGLRVMPPRARLSVPRSE